MDSSNKQSVNGIESKRESLKEQAAEKHSNSDSNKVEKDGVDSTKSNETEDKLQQQRDALKDRLNEKETSKDSSQGKDDGLGY